MSNSQSRDVLACDGAVSAGTALPGTTAASGLEQKHQSAQKGQLARRYGWVSAPYLSAAISLNSPRSSESRDAVGRTRDGQAGAQACPGICLPSPHTHAFTSTCSERSTSAPLPVAPPPPVPPLKQETLPSGNSANAEPQRRRVCTSPGSRAGNWEKRLKLASASGWKDSGAIGERNPTA